MLACPLRGHWTSFRLVDEHGDGKPYGGLHYTVMDSIGQEYTGRLDGEGFAKLENHYRGPVVLTLSTAFRGVDDVYNALLKRNTLPSPHHRTPVPRRTNPLLPRRRISSRI